MERVGPGEDVRVPLRASGGAWTNHHSLGGDGGRKNPAAGKTGLYPVYL